MRRPKLHGLENDLHRAIRQGNLPAVRAWIAAGESLEGRDPTATTPLALAAYFNKPAAFAALLAAGASTDATDEGNHALFYAAWRGSRAMVRALLDKDVDIDGQFKNAAGTGQTALMGAAKGGHLALVKLLVGLRARLGLTDRDGKTALDYADEHGADAVVEYLRAANAPGRPVARKRPAKPHPGEELVEAGRQEIARFPGLAARSAYKEFLARLTKLAGTKPKAYQNPNGGDYGRLAGVYALTIPAQRLADRPDLLAELREQAGAAGGTLVDARFGRDPRDGGECVLFPTADKAAIILAQGTSSNGIVGAETEDIVAFIAGLDRQNPFRLTACSHDAIAGEFAGRVKRATTWARRLLEICPGEGEAEARPEDVAAALEDDGCFLLWWD